MMPRGAYLAARTNARHHVQLSLVDRADDGWARGHVERVFRSDRLKPGDDLLVCIPVIRPGVRPRPGGERWTRLAHWRTTSCMEVFLDGDPPRCSVVASQWSRLNAPTATPRMAVPTEKQLSELKAAWSNTDRYVALAQHLEAQDKPDPCDGGSGDDGSESAAAIDRSLVLTAADLVGLLPGFVANPDAFVEWEETRPELYSPEAFDLAFLPYATADPCSLQYEYFDSSRNVMVKSVFTAAPREPSGNVFDEMPPNLRGLLKSDLLWRPGVDNKGRTTLVAAYDLKAFTFERRPIEIDGTDEAACFCVIVPAGELAYTVRTRTRWCYLDAVIGGFACKRPDDLVQPLRTIVDRIGRFLDATPTPDPSTGV